MPGRRKKFCSLAIRVILAPLVLLACSLDNGPDKIFIDTPITVEVLEGAGAADTVQAHLSIRVALIPEDDEVRRPMRIDVSFSVLGEDCGEPQSSLATSDENDEARGSWILGTLAQDCTMEVRALASDGTTLGFVQFDATIEPGQPVEGWLDPGVVERAIDTLAISAFEFPLNDRFSNELIWRFQIIDGPAVVLSEELADDRSRTLVATGEGSGRIDVVSGFGAYLRAGFNVCIANEQRWIRVFRLEDADTVLAACP